VSSRTRWEKLHRVGLRQDTRVIVLGEDMRDRMSERRGSARVVISRDGIKFTEQLPPPENPG